MMRRFALMLRCLSFKTGPHMKCGLFEQPKILEDSPFSFVHAAMELYPFCVEQIKVLEVLFNQGFVTLNSVF